MPVGDLGPTDVITTDRETTLDELAETLETEKIGAVAITDDETPVGIVTDRDLALAIATSDDVNSLTAADVMTKDPVTIREDEEAIELSRAIGEHNVRRILVVDDQDNLTSIVTLDDLIATIGEQLDNIASTVEAQSPDYSP